MKITTIDKTIRYPAKFSTIEGNTYIGWWEGKKFQSKVFKPNEKKSADELYSKLREHSDE